MTLHALYLWGKQELAKAESKSSAFDAVSLFSAVFGLDRHGLILHGQQQAEPDKEKLYRQVIARCAGREPLQYILGAWPFMDMSFAVGPGVLIPREETQTLVEEGVRRVRALGRRRPVVYDLCAGSGAVGAGLAQSFPEADIWCFEISEDAWPYLEKNLKQHAPTVEMCRMDVMSGQPAAGIPKPDVILSNPPYIPTGDLLTLPPEVRREPVQALDGGDDGLAFYRVIAEKWCKLLPPDGGVAVEIGMGQAEEVCALFAAQGLRIERVLPDENGIARVVSAGYGKN